MILLQYLSERIQITHSGCWLWTKSTTKGGYGQFRRDGKQHYAHIAMYELMRGRVPPGLELDHTCRTRRCCNPDHLDPVPHRENVLRGMSPSARSARAAHCVNGHKFTAENTIHIQGGRRCRQCVRERNRKYGIARYGVRGNAQARKTHCPRGHPYDDLNTYRHNGRRQCRECMRTRNAARKKTERGIKHQCL